LQEPLNQRLRRREIERLLLAMSGVAISREGTPVAKIHVQQVVEHRGGTSALDFCIKAVEIFRMVLKLIVHVEHGEPSVVALDRSNLFTVANHDDVQAVRPVAVDVDPFAFDLEAWLGNHAFEIPQRITSPRQMNLVQEKQATILQHGVKATCHLVQR
jgi:hypothetical protein